MKDVITDNYQLMLGDCLERIHNSNEYISL